MNYYRAFGYTEINNKPQEIDILIGHESINRARMIASRYITNSSHFEEYPLSIDEFGIPSFIINHEGEKIQIISSIQTIKEAFKCLSDIGMDIVSLDSLANPLKPNIQHMIWGMLCKEFGISNDDPFTRNTEEDEAIDNNLTATQLIKITELITHILNDAKELYVRVKGIIGGDSFIIFTSAIEQLQQTLHQGQIFIAKEQTKKLISLMEKIEGEFMEYERARDHKLQSQITIPNLNAILSNNQRSSAHKLYETQVTQNRKVEQRYQTIYQLVFHKSTKYIQSILKDATSFMGNGDKIINFFVRKIEYTLIITSMIIVIMLQHEGHNIYRGTALYTIGILGFAIQWYSLIQIKDRYIRLGVISLLMVMTGVAGYYGASNLALI